ITIKTSTTRQFKKSAATVSYQLKKGKFKIEFNKKSIEVDVNSEDYKLLQQNPSLPIPQKVRLKTKSSDPSVINISGNTWQVRSLGKTTITQYISGNDYYEDSEGSYEVIIYRAPSLYSFGYHMRTDKRKPDNKDWLPAFKGDAINVLWTLGENNNIYENATSVDVELVEKGGNVLDKKHYSADKLISFKTMKTPFEAKTDYWDKNVFIRVILKGNGPAVFKKETDSFHIKKPRPDQIWKSLVVETKIIKTIEDKWDLLGRLQKPKDEIKFLHHFPETIKVDFFTDLELMSPMIFCIKAKVNNDELYINPDNKGVFDEIKKSDEKHLAYITDNIWNLEKQGRQWQTNNRGYHLYVYIKYNGHTYTYRSEKQHYYQANTARKIVTFKDEHWEFIP
ncbi:hypothetical protein, partial [Xenorhabdus santafensis]|uniref:hypothetical protein n=1 Tax=Xenorhabdus santafensis TaxID=2582833 RepID=UPI0029E7F17F